jgi:hypothetical protein
MSYGLITRYDKQGKPYRHKYGYIKLPWLGEKRLCVRNKNGVHITDGKAALIRLHEIEEEWTKEHEAGPVAKAMKSEIASVLGVFLSDKESTGRCLKRRKILSLSSVFPVNAAGRL